MPNLLQASLGTMAGALAKNLAFNNAGQPAAFLLMQQRAEAVEGALKLARAATGRQKLIYCGRFFSLVKTWAPWL
jgi:putrescine aminotransferase